MFQTLYKLPNTKDQIRFALTRTYKAPPTQQLIPRRFNSANNSQTEPDNQGNPALKPELALGFDAAYEHYFAEGAMFSISGSVRKIDNYTRTAIILGADGRWVALPSNDGEAFSRSIEFETKFPLKAVMNTKLPIDFRFNMNRNWSTVDNVPGPYNRLDQQTPFSATVGVDYKAGALSAGSSFSFRNGGLVRLSQTQYAYGTVRRELDAYALWKFDPKNQVRVALTNILAQNSVQQNWYLDNDNSLRKRTTYFPGDTAIRVTLETNSTATPIMAAHRKKEPPSRQSLGGRWLAIPRIVVPSTGMNTSPRLLIDCSDPISSPCSLAGEAFEMIACRAGPAA